MFDADRIDLRERNGDVAEVRLVIQHADAVIGIAVDDKGIISTCPRGMPSLGNFARRAYRGPQAGKSRTEHKNARHAQR